MCMYKEFYGFIYITIYSFVVKHFSMRVSRSKAYESDFVFVRVNSVHDLSKYTPKMHLYVCMNVHTYVCIFIQAHAHV